MVRFAVLAALAALVASTAVALAVVAPARRQPQVVVARVSTLPARRRAGSTVRLGVVLVDRAPRMLRGAGIAYEAVRRVGDRSLRVSLGSEAVRRRLAPGRDVRLARLLKLPRTLPAGTYRVVTCAWPGRATAPRGRVESCRRSRLVKVSALPPLPQPSTPPGPPSSAPGSPSTPPAPQDTTPPALALELTPASPDGANGYYRAWPTVHASADDADLASLDCNVDGRSALHLAGTRGHLDGDVPSPGDGTHAISCRATDAAGNTSTKSATAKLDSKPPAVSITQPQADATTSDRSPTFAGTAGTASGDSTSVEVKVYAGGSATGSPVADLAGTRDATGAWSATDTLPYGTYTAVTSQGDEAGNTGTSAPDSFDVPAVLAAAGDIASCDETTNPWTVRSGQSTAALLGTIDPDVVAPLGDNAYEDGTLAEYQQCYGPTWGVSPLFGATRPTPGNHEYTSLSNGGYFGYFAGLSKLGTAAADSTQGWYSYDLGRWHVVVLNTSDGCSAVSCVAGSAQETWLKSDLAAHPGMCTLAYWHHPLFTSANPATGVTPEVAALPFWQDLKSAGADLVLNGHAHMYERFAPQDPDGTADSTNGITEVVAGTGGYSEQTASPAHAPNSVALNSTTYGVLELWLGARGYRFHFVPVAGSSWTDSGGGTCHETG